MSNSPEYARAYYLANREKIQARARAWKLANPDRVKASLKKTAARRTRFLSEVKTTCGCVDCGTREGLLHFDHRPGTVKRFDPATGVRHSWRALIEEIEKCDVRCASCHRRRHWSLITKEERQARMRLVREGRAS